MTIETVYNVGLAITILLILVLLALLRRYGGNWAKGGDL